MDLLILKSFLGWSALLNMIILTYWFLIIIFARDFVYNLHSKWFEIDKKDFSKLHYKLIAIYKILNITFFLIPYIALCIIL